VIQTALYFALGFLSAVLLALIFAPPVWRRAMLLTRRRVEAETPLTLNEIQAQRDGLRAEHAVSERKLEMTLGEMREKAARQLAEFSEKDRQARTLTGDLGAREATIAELKASLAEREQALDKAGKDFGSTAQLLEQRSAELELSQRRLTSTATQADSLQIDVAAQSARIENLSDELKEARQARRDSEEQKRKLETELKALQHALEQEKKRSDEAQTRANALVTQHSDSEARLLRREKEVERLNERLRKVIAEGRRQGATATETPRGKQALVQAEESKLLREEMNTLASQVVAMVARLEGPSSPVNTILAGTGKDASVVYDDNGEVIVSLADRIRALQKAASAMGSDGGEPAKP
jgi:chromosome segregation ATPase